MTKTGALRVALTAAFVAMAATSAGAETPVVGPANNTLEVRVINNNASVMRIYVQDANGGMHAMGRVARSDFKIMEVPREIADLGAFEIKAFPSEPVWSLQGDSDGIRTKPMSLELGDVVNLWLETNLEDSVVEVQRS